MNTGGMVDRTDPSDASRMGPRDEREGDGWG